MLEKENEKLKMNQSGDETFSYGVNLNTANKEEEILIMNKSRGSKRGSPQVQPEIKKSRNEFPCDRCGVRLESPGLLQAHMQEHVDPVIQIKCRKCGDEFSTQDLLEKHTKRCHGDKPPIQYNCNDCPFQGENGLALKKHVQRTKHCPSEYNEKCYTCKKEFTSYWNLMNHRKSDHPSNRRCKFYLKQACIFDSDTCWYRHEEQLVNDLEHQDKTENECKDCEQKFQSKSDLMKHRKMEHQNRVSRCRDYLQGKCDLNDSLCWFIHEQQENKEAHEQVFHEAQESIPPDQVTQILSMITKLSFQVDLLEKMSQSNQ